MCRLFCRIALVRWVLTCQVEGVFDRLKRLCWVLTLVFGGLSSAPVQARTAPEPEVLDADDGTISTPLPLELVTIVEDGEDVVLAAQKLRTTIQEAPSIITVIPRSQLLRRGYRSINDVLRGISGFEGDRWEGNGWQREAFARGLPRTVLVLVNGVNIVEPIRNFVSLDRKIPIEIVERVEVTSGPGGVLWGSNALLGVVNIVTRRVDGRGLQAVAGFGDGPADRVQFKTALGVDYRFNDLVGLFAHLNFYSTAGPELRVHQQKVFGSLPEPAQDGPTLYIPTAATFSPIQRSWYLNFSGRLEIGAFALDWMLPFEDEWRALGFGGAPLTTTYLEGNSIGIGSRGGDSVWVFGASYSDRYSAGDIGLKARAYFVRWQIREDPFGIFPSSPVSLALLGHDRPLVIGLSADLVARTGVSLDVDFQLSNTLTLLTGLESFVDLNHGVVQRSWAADQDGVCPEDFVYDSTDPHLRCHVDDPQVNDVERLSGGAFVHADWKPFSRLGLSAGARVQISDRYDPALLFSGGLVWNFWQEFHLKLFISSGLRPPGTLSTDGVIFLMLTSSNG